MMATSELISKSRRRITAGRPKALSFSNAILLDPDAVLALDGRSMRGLYQQAGEISFYRGLERVIHLGLQDIPPALGRKFVSIAETVPPNSLRDLFIRAFGHGDLTARDEICGMGQWAIFQACWLDLVPADEARWTEQFVEIAEASRAADQHLGFGDFAAAAASLASEARLRPYLTDQALASLASAVDPKGALPSRVAGAVEVLLSNVACTDIATRLTRRSEESFAWLLETGSDGQCNPGRQFTRRMVRQLGPGTLEGLLEQAVDPRQPNREFVDLATLKRWNRGERFPSREKVGPLIRTILGTRNNEGDAELELQRFGNAFGAAGRLHKTLELVRMACALPMPGGRPTGLLHLLGYDSPESWARVRYGFWLEHWR